MSYPTVPAFIHQGNWDDETRAHPALKWFEGYCDRLDSNVFDRPAAEVGHNSSWTLVKSTGEEISGADAAWKTLAEVYAPFKTFHHHPFFVVIWEVEKGWDCLGMAHVCYTLQAPGDEKKTKGPDGKEWDGLLPGAFYFKFLKGGKEGVELGRTEIYSDPSQAMVQMLKRGMLKPEQLMQM